MTKVLIVDDDPVFRLLFEDGLKKYADRFSVLTASDGLEAIQILQHEAISLLVTDIKMPNVNGLELLSYVSANHPGLPCIAMTSYKIPNLRKRLPEDLLHLLSKPLEISEVSDLILSVLEKDIQGGGLRGISVPGFVQLLELEQATCVIEVEATSGEKGLLACRQGSLHNAKYGSLVGEEAALKILGLDNAVIRMKKRGIENISKKIESGLTKLILEAMRQKDELGDS